MNRRRYRYSIRTLMSLVFLLACTLTVQAQEVLERYVKTTENGGSSANRGTSWADALDNLQDAINSLHAAMQAENVAQGRIYVAAGTYNPTESTEAQNSNILNTSFLMYEGITVYGGYPPKPDDNGFDYTVRELVPPVAHDNVLNIDIPANPWDFKYKTVLSGNHSGLEVSYTYSPTKGQYNTRYPSSSYHVVWFGTGEEIESVEAPGHRKGFTVEAGIDGCIIEYGNAASRDLTGHDHMAFGGGAYLVDNTFLRNCEVRRCQATRRGGGVYMDGGGKVEHCYVHTCQASGVAISDGYGGAVCIDYNGSVSYSHLTMSTARIGGGLAICHSPGEYPTAAEQGISEAINPYQPYAVSCVIAQNSTNAEAGGVYLDEGGTVNHCTIVKNNCVGRDITYYGRRHGRSGGIYVRNCGILYNSVLWGNKVAANSDIQFASIQQTGAQTTGIEVYHTALYNQDITEWSNVTKEEVFSLTAYNRPHRAGPGNCCWFEINQEILGPNSEGSLNNDLFAGVDYNTSTLAPKEAQRITTWRPRHNSNLAMKGVQVSQNIHLNSEYIRHAHTPVDILGKEFELVSTLGAIAHGDETYIHALLKPQGKEGREGADKDTPIPTIFVTPQRDNRQLSSDDFYGPFGDTWEHAAMLLSDAVNYFNEHRVTSGEHKDEYLFDGTYYPAVQILIKEGTFNTAGKNNYAQDGEIRTAAIRPSSNMRFYGGYPADLTDDDTEGRAPGECHTIVSSNIVGNYENNSIHSFALINTKNVIIDGVRMFYGNAVGMENADVVTKGSGVIVSNATIAPDERIDMTGNEVRNGVVANTQAYDGAAFYVNGAYTHAELTVTNTVIRNCTSLQDATMTENEEYAGVIVANGDALIHVDHCTIANNEGYPLKTATAGGKEGEIVLTNSALFANSRDVVDYRNNIDVYAATTGSEGTITGDHNMFDQDAEEQSIIPADETNQYLLTTDASSANYPTFKNPSSNVGHSEGVDRPLYGGIVSYEPLNRNPLVNAADDASMTCRDRTDANYFNYGGAADIGAVENTLLPPNGAVIYVTPDGAGRRDGSSWGNAIAGNTIYALNGAAAAGTDQLDTANGTTRIINTTGDGTATIGADHGVLTTDNRYCGGYALYSDVTGSTYLTSHSSYHITETETYIGGDKNGTTNKETREESTNVDDQLVESGVHVTDGRAINPAFPYGEKSGMSRAFWRANDNGTPYGSTTDPYGNVANAVKSGKLNIYNNRDEDYVSGLQYAVEIASAYNTLPENDPQRKEGIDSLQVWVSNGTFTDYKGFVMRDKTTVLGSFPAVGGDIRTPGLNERQTLMSAVVNIPKTKFTQDLDAQDYETILQISDVNPRKDEQTFNTEAIKFRDVEYKSEVRTDINLQEDLNINIAHTYTWDGESEDWTSSHLMYPNFSDGATVIDGNRAVKTTEAGIKYFAFGTPTAEQDCWHLSYPDKTNFVVNIATDQNGAKALYDPETGNQLTGADASYNGMWAFFSNGSLTGVNFWQTIPFVPEGDYQLSVDMAGGYRNKFTATDPTNIFFYILGADGSELIAPEMLKVKATADNADARKRAYRYTFDFTQPTEGPLTIKVVVEDGVRNTKTANATYGTDDGGDPDEIPASYTSSYGSNNPNRREFWLSDLKLTKVGAYEHTTVRTETEKTPTVRTETTTQTTLTEGNTYTTLRKRVLAMPDITIPTFGCGRLLGLGSDDAGGGGGDDMPHTDRVFGPTKAKRKATNKPKYEDPNYVEYSNMFWNGFTIRHGFIYDQTMCHGGGAGVTLYEGAHLQNCIVTDNMSACMKVKGGGVFCDGATSTIEGCFILNNTSWQGTNIVAGQIFAGGLFLYEGTCYNSLIANNLSRGNGGGVGLCVGKFYNNTVAYNTCKNGGGGGGLRVADNAASYILLANTIIYGNNDLAISFTSTASVAPFLHCYIQSASEITNASVLKATKSHETVDDGFFGLNNTFLNKKAVSIENTPFAADVNAAGTALVSNGAKNANDFQLRKGFRGSNGGHGCINDGTGNDYHFDEAMFEALWTMKYPEKTELTEAEQNSILQESAYQYAAEVELPRTDVAFADRIQDCSIDIGAYEYNGAIDILPDTVTFVGEKLAVYYVTENGFEQGDASASSPYNAACAMKLQKVLDAAGRYKYDVQQYPENHQSVEDFDVVVWLGGNGKDQEGNFSTFAYTPERSTKTLGYGADNVLDYSLIIPHGVQLWGGFWSGAGGTTGFYQYEDASGNVVDAPFESDGKTLKSGVTVHLLRDVLRYPTYLSGNVVSSTGATGQAFHVVHFTNDLFDTDEKIIGVEQPNGEMTYGQLEALTDEKDRAVLDGLFIKDGYANGAPANDGSMTSDQNGAAAIVTSFAHVRNCIVTDNRATGYGGGLYLEPHALVSGSVVKNNEALMGGGIYVEQPAGDAVNDDTFAFILTSTVVGNNATQRGGGLAFESNLRANSSVFWHNTAIDKSNVSGNQVQSQGESSSISTVNYPMVYCGVEVTRWEGVNNLLISASETEGVRWDHQDYYEGYHSAASDESLYYPIEMSSVLSRAGMTYQSYDDYRKRFPTLELVDMAGYQRMKQEETVTVTYDGTTAYIRKKKDNALIEMGARVVNATYEVKIDVNHIMKRLYVVHTEDLESETARRLQDNGYTDEAYKTSNKNSDNYKKWNRATMYSQMGSCFANPFHRLGDALQYILNVRNSTERIDTDDDGEADMQLGEYYRNHRFEIFVTNGTFYPYRNAYGQQAASRSNTFVIPEMVSLIGGVDNTKPYGQDGYGEVGTDGDDEPIEVLDGTPVPLKSYKTQTIRANREQSDLNMNNVVEPWELNSQTILSGNVVSGTESKNAYHVITCFPDETKVGKLPLMYSDDELNVETTVRTEESRASKAHRTIVIDGVTVMNGLANDIGDEDKGVKYQRLTYFRGGGIFVDGNWDKVDELADYTPEVIGPANRDIPLLVTHSQFQDNMAGNGGAIYTNGTLTVTACNFAQNSSRGPDTELDQQLIPWTAGGAIATNYDCTVVNTIFANNEAKRGKLPITINGATEGVEMADIRQGFGGVISSSETSTVHALNCNFVRNKAVAFPAIYNFVDQDQKRNGKDKKGNNWERNDWRHWAVNCLFWGNEANTDTSAGGQVDGYAGNSSNDSEMRTLGSLFTPHNGGTTARNRADIANFGYDNRDLEVCFFCAYEQPYGLESKLMVKKDSRDNQKTDVPTTGDTPPIGWKWFEQGHFIDDYPEEWTETRNGVTTRHTHNQYLEEDNEAIGGPNFIQPSQKAGIDGYMQNADWLVSRLNRIIDNGWSFLPQQVTASKKEVEGEWVDVFNTTFEHEDGELKEVLVPVLDDDGQPMKDENGETIYTKSTTYEVEDEMDNTSLKGSGIYNFFSLEMDKLYGGIGMTDLAALGEHPHMKYDREGATTGMSNTMRRISTYPKQGEQEVFIDIGVYEYQYVQLFIPGNAYDVIWVRPDNPTNTLNDPDWVADGTTWERATNNVQDAIDMLMASHNDHDKVLKVREGTYSPVYLTHGQLSYYIEHDLNPNSVLYPSNITVADYKGVNSITIKGGYPNDATTMIPDAEGNYDGEEWRDPELHPTIFAMASNTGYEDHPEVKENLFIIQNMERQEANQNFISVSELHKRGVAVPVTFDGITFSNPYAYLDDNLSTNMHGATILYTEQHKAGNEQQLLDPPARLEENELGEETYVTDGRPKLLIKDCIFLNSSTEIGSKTPVAAVHILGGGGDAVVANSLFHSNGGRPIRGVNTKVVNCTFAMNGGQLTLTNNDEAKATGSVMHNSIVWRDGLTSAGVPYDFGSADMLGMHNVISDWHSNEMEYVDDNGNQPLSRKNSDILTGPNFANPMENVANANPWLRDMHPRASVRVVSQGNRDKYEETVPFYADTSSVVTRSMMVNGEKRKSIVQTVTRTLKKRPDSSDEEATTKWTKMWNDEEKDLAHEPRFTGLGLERGPYEVMAAIQRVLYVNSNLFDRASASGANWTNAFGTGQLQDAIDAAGVYSATNGNQRAYVFAHGNGLSLEPAVEVRDGVTVFGSVVDTYDEVKSPTPVSDGREFLFKEKEIFNYINRVRASRSGVASSNQSATSLLSGVRAVVDDNEEKQTKGFVLDGFHITNNATQLTESPLLLHNDLTLLRNCVVRNNRIDESVKSTVPVVDIKGGLLYNTLVYDNDAQTQVNVVSEATGGVLNCTVVANGADQTAINTATTGKVVNAITYNERNTTSLSRLPETPDNPAYPDYVNSNMHTNMFAPYLRNGANAYNYPFGTQQTLWYQLHEQSQSIDGGTDDWASYFPAYTNRWEGLKGEAGDDGNGWIGNNTETTDDQTAQRFIDFSQDRDVLGNPRQVGSHVDQGAFETWRVDENDNLEVTNETNTEDADGDGVTDSPIQHYGGHYYPHLGSVVYIGKNASLRARRNNFLTSGTAMQPGYLLLKEGASLYGQGNYVRAAYVATEHTFAKDATLGTEQYALFALPYTWNKANIVTTTYDSGTDALAQTDKSSVVTNTQRYDGTQRAEWNYAFHTADSPCWTDTDETTANEGYLLTMSNNDLATGTGTMLRFTAWGVNELGTQTDIYTEDGTDKTVALQQHDEMPTDGKAHFTTNENMGWNLKGMPWLVNGFKTHAVDGNGDYDGSSEVYQMNVPHLFYQMDKTGSYIAASQSWADGSQLSYGDAYFTQTAILDEEELLKFRTPYYYGAPVMPARPRLALGTERVLDVLEVYPSVNEEKKVRYHAGEDGEKWLTFNEAIPQFYALSDEEVGMSLLAHAPLDTDIPLALYAGGDEPLHIWLPEAEAFEGLEGVWLKDHQTGSVVNLLEDSYTLQPTEEGTDTRRLTLRLGGYVQREADDADQTYRVYGRAHTLHIEGLTEGDHIQVYDPAGRLYRSVHATGYHYATDLNAGVYVVRIGQFVRKIRL